MGLLRGLLGLLPAVLLAWGTPILAEEGNAAVSDAADALWRGMERSDVDTSFRQWASAAHFWDTTMRLRSGSISCLAI